MADQEGPSLGKWKAPYIYWAKGRLSVVPGRMFIAPSEIHVFNEVKHHLTRV
jgi:hypothetical protein